mmetsp:Transcript_27783/g.62848  ORF Transcript_27783/g.62848 Transcript_27783/m.62848 type:complete len:112 (-) Transcript_27783:343-678(-)
MFRVADFTRRAEGGSRGSGGGGGSGSGSDAGGGGSDGDRVALSWLAVTSPTISFEVSTSGGAKDGAAQASRFRSRLPPAPLAVLAAVSADASGGYRHTICLASGSGEAAYA